MGPQWRLNHDLSRANTLGLPSVAAWYAAPRTLSALQACLTDINKAEQACQVLGRGSNVLLPPFLPGATLRAAFAHYWFESMDEERVRVQVGAGVDWHQLVCACAQRGLWGIENLAMIPGDCGAAPVQNIGAYGVEVGEVIEAVQVCAISTGQLSWLGREACEFRYRDSIFKRTLAGQVIITRLSLVLSRTPKPRLDYGDLAKEVEDASDCAAVVEAVCRIRASKLPSPERLANAGSFFKNPVVSKAFATELLARYPDMPTFPQSDGSVKLAAGWMIETCGWKGARWGAFGVHDRQALVLVHFGGGDRAGLLELAAKINEQVKSRFGLSLDMEPRLL